MARREAGGGVVFNELPVPVRLWSRQGLAGGDGLKPLAYTPPLAPCQDDTLLFDEYGQHIDLEASGLYDPRGCEDEPEAEEAQQREEAAETETGRQKAE